MDFEKIEYSLKKRLNKSQQSNTLFSQDAHHLAESQMLGFHPTSPPEIDKNRRILIKVIHKE